MAWRSIHPGHAIERVRVQTVFTEPLPSKVLARCSEPLIAVATSLGFNEVSQADSNVLNIHVAPTGQSKPLQKGQNGWSFRRKIDQALTEELALRDGVFGYVSTQYDRWADMRSRLQQVFEPAVAAALDVSDATALKLEYWDSFVFDGDRIGADASDLLSARPALVPDSAYSGPDNWHSHFGWFEWVKDNRLLINQNFDAVDLHREGEEVDQKALNIYTLTEHRFESWKLDASNLIETIDLLHERSLQIFARSITPELREVIGIDEQGKVSE